MALDRRNTFHGASNRNGLIHCIVARRGAARHDHASLVSTLMSTRVDSFVSAISVLTCVVITESLTNAIGDELSESAASISIKHLHRLPTSKAVRSRHSLGTRKLPSSQFVTGLITDRLDCGFNLSGALDLPRRRRPATVSTVASWRSSRCSRCASRRRAVRCR
jgi:hypothetical protein